MLFQNERYYDPDANITMPFPPSDFDSILENTETTGPGKTDPKSDHTATGSVDPNLGD